MTNSDIKRLLKSFIPPVLLKIFKNKPQLKPTYLSYDEALKNCSNISGYEEDDIVKVVLEKTKLYKKELENNSCLNIDATTAYGVFALNQCFENTDEINVLDFGGACGLHYFTFKKLLNNSYRFNWTVVETANMCKYARELENEELHFYDDIETAAKEMGKIDLVFSSGTIQSVKNPHQTLELLFSLNAKNVFLTRLSFTKSNNEVIVVQQTMLSENGHGNLPELFKDKKVEYPHTSISEDIFNDILSKQYKIFFKFDETSGIHYVNDEPITGYGVLARRL